MQPPETPPITPQRRWREAKFGKPKATMIRSIVGRTNAYVPAMAACEKVGDSQYTIAHRFGISPSRVKTLLLRRALAHDHY